MAVIVGGCCDVCYVFTAELILNAPSFPDNTLSTHAAKRVYERCVWGVAIATDRETLMVSYAMSRAASRPFAGARV